MRLHGLPLLLLNCCAALSAAAKPHVLFVLADDLGFNDLGFMSSEIHTPAVDKLAAEGMVLQQYYVQDVCSPSRATFMTGRYAMHHGVVDWIPPTSAYGLPVNETTMADKFKEAGYVTRAVGKWHLGFFRKELTPTFRGFDSFYGFYSGGEDYFEHTSSGAFDFRRDPSPRCGPNCSRVASEAKGRYSTHLFTAEAVSIIQAHPAEKPLFMYLAYQAVHAPAEVPPEYELPYASSIKDTKRRTFAGMLSCLDEGLANVTAALSGRGMLENTLIVFSTDNGGPTTTGDGVGARNWPLRGGKHSIWEGGTRAAGVLWGSMVPKGESWALMHGADWMPTLGHVAGFDVSSIPLPLDGIDQWPALTAGAVAPRQGFVYGNSTNDCSWASQQHPELAGLDTVPCGFGIRNGSWKLTLGWGGGPDTWCNSTAKGSSCWNGTQATCTQMEAQCLPGNDLSSAPCSSAQECCAQCTAVAGCVAWTFNTKDESTCFLKGARGASTVSSHCTSGVIGPTCLESGFCLWDVVQDPRERIEVSQQHQSTVASMKAEMAVVLSSYRQEQPDPACGPVVYEHDPVVGKSWAPWC